MVIEPIKFNANGFPTLYRSGPVYTVIKGKRVWVSGGYVAKTPAEICRRAFVNVEARRMVHQLAQKMDWSSGDLPLEQREVNGRQLNLLLAS